MDLKLFILVLLKQQIDPYLFNILRLYYFVVEVFEIFSMLLLKIEELHHTILKQVNL
jgi:hypothetical protein